MKTGSMMRVLALSAAVSLGGLCAAGAAEQRVDLELVLAVDISGSVDDEEAKLQREGYIGAISSPSVLAAIRSGYHKRIAVTYVEWSGGDQQSTVVDWMLLQNRASTRAFAVALAAAPSVTGRYTSISGAIDYSLPKFATSPFKGSRRVIDISGDGANNSGRLVTFSRDIAVAAGVTINGLPIVNDRPNRFGRMPIPNLDLYYRKCVIGGPGAFLVVAEDFRSFARAIRRKLIMEIAGVLAPGEGDRSTSMATSPWAAPSLGAGLPLLRPVAALGEGYRLWRAVARREAPPCDIGELRLRERWERYDDLQ